LKTRIERLIAGVEEEGWRFVALVRLVPLFPFSLSNYALGLTRIPLGQYALTSLVCMVPGTLAHSWLGHAGREAAEGSTDAIRYGLLGLAVLAAIAFAPFAVIVLMAHMLKVSTPVTQWCAILFFWLRVAHAIGMISGKARLPVRPLIYVSCWIITLVLAWTVWANAR